MQLSFWGNCHELIWCLIVLVFVLFGFAQVAGSSFRESAQVSNCLKMWQKHKLRHHSATALPGREVQSLRFVDLLPHSKHFYSNTTKASKSSRQENKTSLQKSKEPWTQSIKIGNKSNILIQLKWSHMISPLKEWHGCIWRREKKNIFSIHLLKFPLPTDVPWHDLHDLFPEDLRHEVRAFSFCQHDGLWRRPDVHNWCFQF